MARAASLRDRSRSAAALLLAACGAPALAQGLPPVSVDAILDGARSCAAATSPGGVDEAALQADGWRRATMSKDGTPIDSPLTMYGKAGLLLMLDKGAKQPVCLFTGRLAAVTEFPKVQAAFAARYGAPVKDDGKGDQLFVAPDHRIVDIASTGSQERPAVRVAVGPVFEAAK